MSPEELSRYEVKRDPYSDNPNQFVVWDNSNWRMPFQGGHAACRAWIRSVEMGIPADVASDLHSGSRR